MSSGKLHKERMTNIRVGICGQYSFSQFVISSIRSFSLMSHCGDYLNKRKKTARPWLGTDHVNMFC